MRAPVRRVTAISRYSVFLRDSAAVVTTGCGWRDVHCRVVVEEPGRTQREPDSDHGHDRPVLGTDDVLRAERVPDDEVGVLERPVWLDVLRQSGAAGVLVRVLARRVHLLGV